MNIASIVDIKNRYLVGYICDLHLSRMDHFPGHSGAADSQRFQDGVASAQRGSDSFDP